MNVGIEIVIPILTSVFGAGVTYGVLKVRMNRTEEALEEMQSQCTLKHEKLDQELHYRENKWVSKEMFQAVIGPINHTLEELQRDVKKILTLVSRGNS